MENTLDVLLDDYLQINSIMNTFKFGGVVVL